MAKPEHRARYWSARDELKSLRKHAEITGCDLRELIEISPKQRADLALFCQRHPPGFTKSIRAAVAMREWMLERL